MCHSELKMKFKKGSNSLFNYPIPAISTMFVQTIIQGGAGGREEDRKREREKPYI